MSNIDDRVVAMKFDNAVFEQKLAATISSLEKLKGSLNFGASTKNLEALSSVTKGFDGNTLNGMASAIDGIAGKFTALGVTAATVISNITTGALGMAQSLVSSFTINPISDGFREFETNMNSVQTILANTASKGTTLDQVTTKLDELNTYSDKTIYNFGQMTSNVGKFTAAGVDLETSVSSIKGLSNFAALAGAGAEQAAGAMYQLSQAMARGTLNAQDWMSVTAGGLDSEILKTTLFETAKAMGTLSDVPLDTTFQEWTKAGGNFRETMAEGVFTTDVMATSFAAFSGDIDKATLLTKGFSEAQADSVLKNAEMAAAAATEVKTLTQLMGTLREAVGTGWSDTFKKIFGNFDEAKIFFTGLNTIFSGIIGRISESRNAMLQSWKDLGGREAIIQSLRNVMWSLALIIGTVHKAFRDAFPKTTGEELANFSKIVEKVTRFLIPSENTLKIISGTFKLLFGTLAAGWGIIKTVAAAIYNLFGGISDGVDSPNLDWFIGFFERASAKIEEFRAALVDGGGISDFVNKFIKPVIDFIKGIDFGGYIDQIVAKFNELKRVVDIFLTQINAEARLKAIGDAFIKFKDDIVKAFGSADFEGKVKPLLDIFDKLFGKDAEKTFAGGLGSTVGASVGKSLDSIGVESNRLSERWQDFLKIGKKLGGFFDKIEEQIGKLGEKFTEAFGTIGDAFESGNFDGVWDKVAVGLLGGLGVFLINFLRNGPIAKLTGGLWNTLTGGLFNTIKESIGGLTGVFQAMQTQLKAEALQKIAIAIAILVGSILVLSLIDSKALGIAMAALTLGIGELAGVMVLFNKMVSGPEDAAKIGVLALAMLGLSIAVRILASAVKKFSELNFVDLQIGILAVTELLAALGILQFALGKAKMTEKNARDMLLVVFAIVAITTAVNKLADIVKMFAEMDFDKMQNGIAGITEILGILIFTMKHLPDNSGKAAGVGLLALGLLLMVKVVEKFGALDMPVLIQGLFGISGALLALTVAIKNMPVETGAIGLGLIFVALSLMIVYKAVSLFGEMDLYAMEQGLIGIGLALFALALACNAMAGAITGAFAIGVAAVSLLLLADALKVFDTMGIGTILLALLGMGIAIAFLAGASLLLAPILPIMAGLAAVMILFGYSGVIVGAAAVLIGVGFALIAGSILAIAYAVKILAEVGPAGVRAMSESFKDLGKNAAAGIVNFLTVILEAGPELVGALVDIGEAMIEGWVTLNPLLGNAINQMISTLIDIVTESGPKLLVAGLFMLRTILDGIDKNAEDIAASVISIMLKFANTFRENMPEMTRVGAELFIAFLAGVGEHVDDIVRQVKELVLVFLVAVGLNMNQIIEAGGNLIRQFIAAIGEEVPGITQEAVKLIVTFMTELGSQENITRLTGGAAQLILNFINGLSEAIKLYGPQLRTAGIGLAKAIAEGMVGGLFGEEDATAKQAEAFSNKVKNALNKGLGVNSPSKEMIKTAGFVAAGLVIGFQKDTSAADSAGVFGENVKDKLNAAILNAIATVQTINEVNPVVKPVIDLTNVEDGYRRITAIHEDGSWGAANGMSWDPNTQSFRSKRTIGSDGSVYQDGKFIGKGVAPKSSALASALANEIAAAQSDATLETTPQVQSVTFEQTINSPTSLSVVDIYRGTKSQFQLAKEALNV